MLTKEEAAVIEAAEALADSQMDLVEQLNLKDKVRKLRAAREKAKKIEEGKLKVPMTEERALFDMEVWDPNEEKGS